MILIRADLTFRKLKDMSTIGMNASLSIKWKNISFTINQLWRRALPLKLLGFPLFGTFSLHSVPNLIAHWILQLERRSKVNRLVLHGYVNYFFIILNILLLYIRNFVSSTFNLICWVLNIIINRQFRNANNLNILWLIFVYNNMTPSFRYFLEGQLRQLT